MNLTRFASFLALVLLVATKTTGEQHPGFEYFKGEMAKAEKGDVWAQAEVGRCYAEGWGTPADDVEAAKWWRRAAGRGDVLAQFKLGKALLEEPQSPADVTEAAKWFRKAADQGHSGSQFNLAELLANGWGVPQDSAAAAKWYRKAAEQFSEEQSTDGVVYRDAGGVPVEDPAVIVKAAELGDPLAQFALGMTDFQGTLESAEKAGAAKWFHRAAAGGYTVAQFWLGRCYAMGLGVPKDEVEALKWWRKAAGQGNVEAQATIGIMCEAGPGHDFGTKSVPKDEVEAMKWFLLAGAQGNDQSRTEYRSLAVRSTPAQQAEARRRARDFKPVKVTLADFAPKRQERPRPASDVKPDIAAAFAEREAALKDLRARAEQGDANAQAELGGVYAEGRGVRRDAVEAAKWCRKAADQGDVLSQMQLGYLYECGQGVPRDGVEAMKWYRKAAERGNPSAQRILGDKYNFMADQFNERIVPRDDAESARWHRKAADQGEHEAQFQIGIACFKGEGVAQDVVEAYKWMILASSSQTAGWLIMLEGKMTPGQIAEGKKRAAEFKQVKESQPANK